MVEKIVTPTHKEHYMSSYTFIPWNLKIPDSPECLPCTIYILMDDGQIVARQFQNQCSLCIKMSIDKTSYILF